MAVWQWSLTAASNASADPTISWAEGMSPSTVNDSSRAEMSRLADYRDLIAGKLVTTGTGTALVLASGQNPVFDTLAHMDGAMIGFTPNTTNTGPVTLAVDGLTAKPIRSQTGASGELGAGVLIQSTPYIATYYNSVGEFILQGFVGQPFTVPVGSILFHSVPAVPNSNFVLPIGQAISRTTYATYFALVGTTYGVGDGSTTFNVPDLRSRILLPHASMGGSDPGRVTTAGSGIDGNTLGVAGGAQNETIAQANLPNVSFNNSGIAASASVPTTDASKLSAGGVNVPSPGAGLTAGAAAVTAPVITITNQGSAASGGIGTPLVTMPPVLVLYAILRVL